jgi:hypothetical protein
MIWLARQPFLEPVKLYRTNLQIRSVLKEATTPYLLMSCLCDPPEKVNQFDIRPIQFCTMGWLSILMVSLASLIILPPDKLVVHSAASNRLTWLTTVLGASTCQLHHDLATSPGGRIPVWSPNRSANLPIFSGWGSSPFPWTSWTWPQTRIAGEALPY